MPKRRIQGKYGKQLYLNKIFHKGMLHTSSEMKEGTVKTISNYDIVPTGDSARPRAAFSIVQPLNETIEFSKYTYPVKFNQSEDLHYIEFLNTISERTFASYKEGNSTIILEEDKELYSPSLKVYSRKQDAIETVKYEECLNEEKEYTSSPKIIIKGEETQESTNYLDAVSNVELEQFPLYASLFNNVIVNVTDSVRDFVSIIEELLTNIKPYDEEESQVNRIEVIDGDTINAINPSEGDIRIRLLGIDSAEFSTSEQEEWGEYAKTFLNLFLNGVVPGYLDNRHSFHIVKDLNADIDNPKYQRSLRWVFLAIKESPSSEEVYYLNLSELMVRLGLAEVSYLYDRYLFTQDLIRSQAEAKDEKLNMWSNDKLDPYWEYSINSIIYEEDYVVQVVEIKQENQITHKLKNRIEQVEFVYIDYLDAIGFIGAVFKESVLIYKGLLLLIAEPDKNGLNFKFQIAPNDGEGEKVSISESVGTGINLYNKEPLNLNNVTDLPNVEILGIIATDMSPDKNLITKASPGSVVNLHGILNTKGFPISRTTFLADNVKFKATLKVITKVEIGVGPADSEGPLAAISIIGKREQEDTYVFDNENQYEIITVPTLQAIFKDTEYFNESKHYVVLNNYNVSFLLNINILTPFASNEKVEKVVFSKEGEALDIDIDYDSFYFDNLELTLAETFLFKLEKLYNSDGVFTFKLKNNLENILLDLSEPAQPTGIEPIFLSRWERAGRLGDWQTIKEFENYKLNGNDLGLINNTENYIQWTVDVNEDTVIRYSLVPVVKVQDAYISNPYTVINLTYPNFRVGSNFEIVTNKDLTYNIRIRDLTRLGIYNRQLYLYGQYGGASVIQFTPFEKIWYFPFPYFNVSIDEPIIHIHQHKDLLYIFGESNIYLMSGGVSSLEMTLFKIYENLSIRKTDINSIQSIGNNVLFMSGQIGYIIVPNKYTNDPEDVKIYKTSEAVSNLLLNPEGYLKARLKFKETDLNKIVPAQEITGEFHSFVEDNVLNIVVSYTMRISDEIHKIPVWFRYDQINYRWSLYDTLIFDSLDTTYTMEPQFGFQFMVMYEGKKFLGYRIDNTLPNDFDYGKYDLGLYTALPVETFIDSGYLSVDTMNDKRFRDLMFEINNIGGAELELRPNFFVDGVPTLVIDETYIAILEDGKLEAQEELAIKTSMVFGKEYGFKLSDSTFGTTERLRVRFPVWGKGRMPQFTLYITAKDDYEFLNFSIIYKEKNIERR